MQEGFWGLENLGRIMTAEWSGAARSVVVQLGGGNFVFFQQGQYWDHSNEF